MVELAEEVLKLTQSKSKLKHMPLPADDPKQRRPDISKARAPGLEAQLLVGHPSILAMIDGQCPLLLPFLLMKGVDMMVMSIFPQCADQSLMANSSI